MNAKFREVLVTAPIDYVEAVREYSGTEANNPARRADWSILTESATAAQDELNRRARVRHEAEVARRAGCVSLRKGGVSLVKRPRLRLGLRYPATPENFAANMMDYGDYLEYGEHDMLFAAMGTEAGGDPMGMGRDVFDLLVDTFGTDDYAALAPIVDEFLRDAYAPAGDVPAAGTHAFEVWDAEGALRVARNGVIRTARFLRIPLRTPVDAPLSPGAVAAAAAAPRGTYVRAALDLFRAALESYGVALAALLSLDPTVDVNVALRGDSFDEDTMCDLCAARA